VLDLVRSDLGLFGNGAERHSTVVGRSAEYSLGEGGEVDLLSQAITVFGKEGVRGDVAGEDIVCC
jgi:hypothetical protein